MLSLIFVFCFWFSFGSIAMHTFKSNISFTQAQYIGREPVRALLMIEFPQLSKSYFPSLKLSALKYRNCRLLIHVWSLSGTAHFLVLRKLNNKSQTAHSLPCSSFIFRNQEECLIGKFMADGTYVEGQSLICRTCKQISSEGITQANRFYTLG